MKKIVLSGLLAVALAAGSMAAGTVSWSQEEGSAPRPAKDFTLTSVRGQSASLKDYWGKGVLLFFFTTWCPYCRAKFPGLIKEYEGLKKEGIELVAIDAGETKAKVSALMEKEHANFDIFLDSKSDVSQAYGVVGVPTFVLVDRNGMIIYEGNDLPGDYKEMLSK